MVKKDLNLKEMIADPNQHIPDYFLPEGVKRERPKVLSGPRELPEKVIMTKKKPPFVLDEIDKPRDFLDVYDIPKAVKDIQCDKCHRIIDAGLPYFKFIWEDAFGQIRSSRTHKFCFHLNPEKDLH